MEQQHKIAESVFNIVFADQGQMLDQSGLLAGLIRNQLAPRMNEVFEACDADSDVVRIHSLEIDLGTVAFEDLEEVFADNLGQALREAIHNRVIGNNGATAGAARKVSAQQRDIDLIKHYLSTGRLPWWAERKSKADVTRTLYLLLDHGHRELVTYLRQQIDPQNPVLSRLVRQFDPVLVQRCIARIAPSLAHSIDQGMAVVSALHTACAVLPLAGPELTWSLSESLLRRLLASTKAFHGDDILVPAALQETAKSLQFDRDQLLQNLITSWKHLRSNGKSVEFEALFSNLLAYLEMDDDAPTTPAVRSVPAQTITPQIPSHCSKEKSFAHDELIRDAQYSLRPSAEPEWILSSQLSKALTHPDLDGLNEAWQRIMTASPETARTLIVNHVQQDTVRWALGQHLTSQQFLDLLKLMIPDYVEFIVTVGDHLAHLPSADLNASFFPDHVTARFREATLTYLTEGRTLQFSPMHYVASTVQRLAAVTGTTYEALLFRLRELLGSSSGTDEPNRRQLLSQVDALHAQVDRGDTMPLQDPNDPMHKSVAALPAQLRSMLQFTPLIDNPMNPSMTSQTMRMEPIAPVSERLSRLLAGLNPDHLPVLHCFLERLPAARLRTLASWGLHRYNDPEAIPKKKEPPAVIPHDSDECIVVIMQWLTENKEPDGKAPVVSIEPPGHMNATTGKHAPSRDGQTESRTNGFMSPAPTDTITDAMETTHVPNAGMVLAAPFLPRLFDRFHLLEEKRFKNRYAAERAIHLLEYMVTERQAAPEFQLVLNKILCGLNGPMPIARGTTLTQEETETLKGLLESVISHWKILGNTSVAGLRSSFLQRGGYVSLKDDAWHLQVESRSFDMLLDQLPWSIGVIKHPWMNRVLHVSWR